MKTVIENAEEVEVLEKACRLFDFNKVEDEDEETGGTAALTNHQRKMITGAKKIDIVEIDDDAAEIVEISKAKKARKRIQPVKVTPQSLDDDDDDILSQAF